MSPRADRDPAPYTYMRYIIAKLLGTQTVEDFDLLLPGNVDNNQISYRWLPCHLLDLT